MKKYNLFIFTIIFSVLFGITTVKATNYDLEIVFDNNESRERLPVSQCDFDQNGKDYFDTTGLINTYLIVKKVPEMGKVTANFTCHSANPFNKDQYNVKVTISNDALIDNEAKTYKEVTYYFYSSQYKNEATVQSMITNSKVAVADASTSGLTDYSSCRRIESYRYVDATQVNDAVAFYIVKSPGKTATIYTNTFDCIKKNSQHSRERVIVRVGMGAKETSNDPNPDNTDSNEDQNDDNQSGENNATNEPRILYLKKAEGNKKLQDYSYCKFKDSSDSNNSFMTNETIDGYAYIKIAGDEPSEETYVLLDCTKRSDDSHQDVKIILSPKYSSDGSSSSGTGSNGSSSNDNFPNHEWGDPDGDCEYIFGDFTNPETFGYMLRQIFKFIQIVGPLLVIILTVLDLVKAVTSGDKDALTKVLKKTSKRMIYAVLLFIFPTILDYILRWTNVYGTCPILKK